MQYEGFWVVAKPSMVSLEYMILHLKFIPSSLLVVLSATAEQNPQQVFPSQAVHLH